MGDDGVMGCRGDGVKNPAALPPATRHSPLCHLAPLPPCHLLLTNEACFDTLPAIISLQNVFGASLKSRPRCKLFTVNRKLFTVSVSHRGGFFMTGMDASYLRPLSMGQVLDRAIRLYRQNFFSFVGIIAIAQIISSIAVILINVAQTETISGGAQTPTLTIFSVLFAMLLVFVSAILLQIATAALTRAVADNYLGHRVSIGEAYRKIGRSWLTLIGASLLMGFLILILVFVFIIPCIGWLLAIPGLGGIVFFTIVALPFMAPVIVLEKQSALAAPGRAWNLARRRFWWLFGFALLLWLFGQLVVTGPAYLTVALTTSLLFNGAVSPLVATTIQQAVTFLFSVIYYPLQLTCITLMYFDVRIRTEGFDLAVLAASDEATASEGVDMSLAVTETKETITPTVEELGYFSLISIGAGFVLLLLWFVFAGLIALFLPGMGGF